MTAIFTFRVYHRLPPITPLRQTRLLTHYTSHHSVLLSSPLFLHSSFSIFVRPVTVQSGSSTTSQSQYAMPTHLHNKKPSQSGARHRPGTSASTDQWDSIWGNLSSLNSEVTVAARAGASANSPLYSTGSGSGFVLPSRSYSDPNSSSLPGASFSMTDSPHARAPSGGSGVKVNAYMQALPDPEAMRKVCGLCNWSVAFGFLSADNFLW